MNIPSGFDDRSRKQLADQRLADADDRVRQLERELAEARQEIAKLTTVYDAVLAWSEIRRLYEKHPDERRLRQELWRAIDAVIDAELNAEGMK